MWQDSNQSGEYYVTTGFFCFFPTLSSSWKSQKISIPWAVTVEWLIISGHFDPALKKSHHFHQGIRRSPIF
jgi:hypothetical protein